MYSIVTYTCQRWQHRTLMMAIMTIVSVCLVPSSPMAASLDTTGESKTQQLPRPPANDTLRDQQEQRIEELQERVKSLEEQQSSILDEIAERVTIGGYGVVSYEDLDAPDSTSFNGTLALTLSGHIHDRIRFFNEIDLGISGEDVQPIQSYVDLLLMKGINLRGGVLQVPFGKFNIDHFDPRRDLTDDPLVARRVIPTNWSDFGISLFGLIPVSPSVKATYEVAIVNGLTDDFSRPGALPGEGLREARSNLLNDNNTNKAIVGRTTFVFVDQYEFGFSGYRGDYDDTSTNAITGFDADFEFKPRGTPVLEDFEFKAEYAYFDIEESIEPSSVSGFYTQVNYHFWPRTLDHTFLGRRFSNPTFTLVGRYGHANIDTTSRTGDLKEDRYTFGLNYRPFEDFVIKTEYQVNIGGIERENADGFLASISWQF
ncbi:MAG TPA: bZIP transcription factor [Nitrospirales bacterium]|nr:bZIP transcription factor [Nitrospirales bacterium]